MNIRRRKVLFIPYLRHTLIETLEDLANKELQLLESPKSSYSHTFWDSMLKIINVFDNLDMSDSPPKNHIGYTLYNHEEAQAISQAIVAVNCVCDKVGVEQPDSAYINSSSWEELINAARHAHGALLANEPLDTFATPEQEPLKMKRVTKKTWKDACY